MAFVIEFVVASLAVAALVGLAAWIGVPRDPQPWDEAKVRALLAEEHPELRVGGVWVAADGQAAVARCGRDRAVLLRRHGDGAVVRPAPWDTVAAATAAPDGRATVWLAEPSAPRFLFRLAEGAAWPPELAA